MAVGAGHQDPIREAHGHHGEAPVGGVRWRQGAGAHLLPMQAAEEGVRTVPLGAAAGATGAPAARPERVRELHGDRDRAQLGLVHALARDDGDGAGRAGPAAGAAAAGVPVPARDPHDLRAAPRVLAVHVRVHRVRRPGRHDALGRHREEQESRLGGVPQPSAAEAKDAAGGEDPQPGHSARLQSAAGRALGRAPDAGGLPGGIGHRPPGARAGSREATEGEDHYEEQLVGGGEAVADQAAGHDLQEAL
mmetsp:Transcript_77138/g.198667  ORF Transcript_77138/g.198667 Transcript_77138/m.198667 type:complete len:249 (+) Transcript_77138:805-1551(+)